MRDVTSKCSIVEYYYVVDNLVFTKKFRIKCAKGLLKHISSKVSWVLKIRPFLSWHHFFFFNSSSLLYSQFNAYYRFQCFALKPNNRSLKTFIIKIMWKCGHYQSSSLETVLKKSCKAEFLYSMSSLVLAFHFLYCEYELYAHIQ